MKMNRLLVAAIAPSLCSDSLFGCGGSSSQTAEPTDDQIEAQLESMDDDDFEEALDSLDAAEAKESAEEAEEAEEAEDGGETVPDEPTEETYEPSEEILNAPITSGLVQIGDDIFKEGGYYTVSSFLEEFGDKYKVSEGLQPEERLDPEGYLEYNVIGHYTLRKIDSEISISIMCVNPNSLGYWSSLRNTFGHESFHLTSKLLIVAAHASVTVFHDCSPLVLLILF